MGPRHQNSSYVTNKSLDVGRPLIMWSILLKERHIRRGNGHRRDMRNYMESVQDLLAPERPQRYWSRKNEMLKMVKLWLSFELEKKLSEKRSPILVLEDLHFHVEANSPNL
ncbi:hypothetical protein Tco_1371182 [Tanacetum coccineum]